MNYCIRLVWGLFLVLLIGGAQASGFQLFEGNSLNVGDFGAGGAANLEDASATFYNPAALSKIPCHSITIAGTKIFKSVRFKGSTDVTLINRSGSFPSTKQYTVDNNANNRVVDNAFVPATFYASPINDKFAIGFGISVPFGLSTDWPMNSSVRYAATKSEIITINFGPGLSYNVNKWLSLGLGFDIQYLKSRIDSMIKTPEDALPDAGDNLSKSVAEGFGVGANAGLLLKITDKTLFSLHYRSRIDHAVTGDSYFSGPLAPNGTIKNPVTTRVTLPDTISSNFAFSLNSKVKLLAGVYYTLWSTVQSIKIANIASPTGPVTESLRLGFKNTWRVVVGSEIGLSRKFLLRFGVGLDQTPTKSKDRSIRLPDNDRIAFSLGAKYAINKILSLDLGYTHLFIRKVNIDSTATTFTQKARVTGNTKNIADLFSVQISAKIC